MLPETATPEERHQHRLARARASWADARRKTGTPIPAAPAAAVSPNPIPTAESPETLAARAEWRRVISRHGRPAITLLASGFSEAEIEAVCNLPAPLAARFGECRVECLNSVQAADIFGVSLARFIFLAKAGAIIEPTTSTPSPRWARSTLAVWAAGGCRWGGVGDPIPELCGKGVSTL